MIKYRLSTDKSGVTILHRLPIESRIKTAAVCPTSFFLLLVNVLKLCLRFHRLRKKVGFVVRFGRVGHLHRGCHE